MSTAESLPVPQMRPMLESDLDFVMEIERSSFSTPWSRISFRNLLGRNDAHLWVAISDGEIIGYAVVWHVLNEAELGNLAVAPSWRRLGLGERLLDWALAKAGERGADRVFLEVRESNEAARRLYERRGFRRVGRRRRYYRAPVEDARVMCLELEDFE